ncbi:MAG: aspartate kinase [Firmicutes bacterium]|nr:aspartate kinase [Bacillota bacterium]
MKILIQKFGGTSVSTEDRRSLVVEKIKKAREEGYSPVVVVSAMGRKGQPYATDTLLSLVSQDFKDANPLAADLLMSCGEIISTVIMCDDLKENGIAGVPLTGGQAGIVTDNKYNNATIVKVNPERILNLLNEDKVPVIAGFQGISESGYVTTLGRGGSDTTASLIGVALHADEIQIYTDVDGIMTADPRIVEDASLIEEISYNEVFQLADEGAKVIHPRAVEIAMKANIPLVIKNTMSDCSGTVISSFRKQNPDNVIIGITSMNDRVQITVEASLNSGNMNYGNILDEIARNNISIDLINIFPKEKVFTIDKKDLKAFSEIMDRLQIKYSSIENCSKLSVVGSRMRGLPGVMAKIIGALEKEGVTVLQTADSHTTIWCLINSRDVEKAIVSLHKDFNLGN